MTNILCGPQTRDFPFQPSCYWNCIALYKTKGRKLNIFLCMHNEPCYNLLPDPSCPLIGPPGPQVGNHTFSCKTCRGGKFFFLWMTSTLLPIGLPWYYCPNPNQSSLLMLNLNLTIPTKEDNEYYLIRNTVGRVIPSQSLGEKKAYMEVQYVFSPVKCHSFMSIMPRQQQPMTSACIQSNSPHIKNSELIFTLHPVITVWLRPRKYGGYG